MTDTCIVKQIVYVGVIDPAESKFVLGLSLLLHSHFASFLRQTLKISQDLVAQIIGQMNELKLPAHQDIYFQFLKSRLPIFNSVISKKRMFAFENNMINSANFKSSNSKLIQPEECRQSSASNKKYAEAQQAQKFLPIFNNRNQNTLGFDFLH